MSALVGVFAGGASRRMGRDKASLESPERASETLIERAVRVAREAGLEVVIVGDVRPELMPEVPRLVDRPRGIGPLGGLAALLAEAGDRPAIALAVDMPYVRAEHLALLASDRRDADVIAGRASEHAPWEPLCARYAPRALPVIERAITEGERSLQRVLARLSVEVATLAPEVLRDWDTPDDLTRRH